MAKETPFNFEQVIYEKEDGIGTIIMNNPKTLNALSRTMNGEVQQAFLDGEADPNIRVFIITGAGDRAFSSGADVTMMAEGLDTRAIEAEQQARTAGGSGVKDVRTPGTASPLPVWIWRNVEKPIVAGINGVVAGMGGVTSLAADIRIMADHARFAHVYMRRGMVCSGETWFLPRLMGLGNALYHILMADDTFAEEALKLGLVSKVVPKEKLMEETRAVAEKLRDGPPVAMRFTKKAIYKGLNWDLFTTMEYVGNARAMAMPSGENREGARSFVEKRQPNFR